MTALFSILLVLTLCSPAAADHDPHAAYLEGVKAFRNGDLSSAASSLEEAVVARPEYIAARFALAQAYHGLFQNTGLMFDAAVEAYETVIETLDDDLPVSSPRHMARMMFGELLVLGGEYRRALGHLQTFLELRPDYYAREAVWNSIGVAHYYLDEYEEAVRAFEQALQAEPSYPAARFNLRSVFTRLSLYDMAMANRRIGRLDVALLHLEQLLELAPRYFSAHLQKAVILCDLKRDAEAEAVVRRALTLGSNPKASFELRELLGDLLGAQGRTAEALGQYRKCLQIFPGYLQIVEKIDALEGRPRDPGGEPEENEPSFDVKSVGSVTEFPM
jgi:tetratricopeptide (TPR) repeat protein